MASCAWWLALLASCFGSALDAVAYTTVFVGIRMFMVPGY